MPQDGMLTTLLVGKPSSEWASTIRRPLISRRRNGYRLIPRRNQRRQAQGPLPAAKLSDAIILAADTFLRHGQLSWNGSQPPSPTRHERQWPFQPTLADENRGQSRRNHVNGEIHDNSNLRDWPGSAQRQKLIQLTVVDFGLPSNNALGSVIIRLRSECGALTRGYP